MKPISLKLRNAEILAQARATLIRAGRGDELKRAHTAAVMRQARTTVARAKEQKRLKAVAALAAFKAIAAVRKAYWEQDKVGAFEFERAAWNARKELVLRPAPSCGLRSSKKMPNEKPGAEIPRLSGVTLLYASLFFWRRRYAPQQPGATCDGSEAHRRGGRGCGFTA